MRPNRRKLLKLLVVIAAFGLLAALSLRVAVRSTTWVGPWLADALRSVIGARAVTRLEQLSANLEDRWNRVRPSRSRPRSLDDVKIAATSAARPLPGPPASTLGPAPPAEAFRPTDVGPMNTKVSAPADGTWRSVADPAFPAEPPALFATLLHPDPTRAWTEVFLVAIQLERVRLHAVAGTVEPVATAEPGRKYRRTGSIPPEQRERMLAAFNGGFKTEHGQHGMIVDGVTLVPPKPTLCTIAGYADGTLAIGTWRKLQAAGRAEGLAELDFARQTPACMVEAGSLNPLLRDENIKNWGATIDGKTVIRRSAIGINAERTLLFVAVSNDTTAPALARALQHAGAVDVAQLDVNWSYPKFLIFPRQPDGTRHAQTLFKGFVFHPEEYLTKPSPRDFFYLTRR